MEPYQVLLLPVKADLGVMAMKKYSIFDKTPAQEPHHQIQFSVISKTKMLYIV